MFRSDKARKHRASCIYLGFGLVVVLEVISGVILSSSSAMAGENATVNIRVNVPASCTLSGLGMDSHAATIANGVYMPNIGTTNMKINCNDDAGFSIYATGFTGNQVGETNSNKLVGTALTNYAVIDTGTNTGHDGNDSAWAMKLDASSSYLDIDILDGYDDYSEVPDGYHQVAMRESGTGVNIGASGVTLTTTYAAYISRFQPMDTYIGKVKYVLVHPGNAHVPTPLYLQDTDGIDAAVPNIGDTTIATDIRDGLDYMVGRLADGNVWLLENLGLDLAMPNASEYITDENTNASSVSLNALFNGVPGGGQDENLARAAVVSEDSRAVVERYEVSSFVDSYTVPVIDSTYMSATLSHATSTRGLYDDDWVIGTYYNFCAASAGSYCYDRKSGSGGATEDICPAGWRMPTDGEYGSLYDEYENNTNQYDAFVFAFRLPFSGVSLESAEWNFGQGRDGLFWSSTSGGIHIGPYWNPVLRFDTLSRSVGQSVRCVMDAD